MQPKTPGLLIDIRDAARRILDRTRDDTLDSFRQDQDLRHIVERNFEIIGEAVRRLNHHDPETTRQITDYREIIAFRNVLVHDYRTIDPVRMWSAIGASLPRLLTEVEAMLGEADHETPRGER